MSRVTSRIRTELNIAEETYGIRSSHATMIVLFPFIVVLLFGFFMALPATRFMTYWMLEENRPVELLTFFFLAVAGIKGLKLAGQTRRYGHPMLVQAFYVLFSVSLLLIAMEEVAWGQWFFGFETPLFFKNINAQGELTIHNIRGLQGHSEFLRLAFGLGGLVGVWACSSRDFHKLGAPAMLLAWFSIITILAAVDLYNDYWPIENCWDQSSWSSCLLLSILEIATELAELVEMLIAISGFLYIWLNARMLAAE